jgi:hypothetical protein
VGGTRGIFLHYSVDSVGGVWYLIYMTETEVTFTEAEFNQQVVEFRKLMGEKSFWALPEEKRDLAVKALGHAYFFIREPQPKIERCADILSQTLEEYNRRHLLLLEIGATVGR